MADNTFPQTARFLPDCNTCTVVMDNLAHSLPQVEADAGTAANQSWGFQPFPLGLGTGLKAGLITPINNVVSFAMATSKKTGKRTLGHSS